MTFGAEFWVAVAFILFVLLLLYYRVPELVTEALDARAAAIKRELEEARKLKEEAQAILADYQRRRGEVENEAQEIIDLAKREAEALAAETRRSLAEALERRTRAAEEKIARAGEQAMAEVRNIAVDVSVAAAERIIAEKLKGARASALVDESIAELASKLRSVDGGG